MLATEIHLTRIPALFRRFAQEVGESLWRRVAADCRQEMKGNSFLRDYFAREYAVVFQLDRISDLMKRYGKLSTSQEELRTLYPAAAFLAQVLSLIDSWTPTNAERLRRRVQGALKNPADLRGLGLEFSVATHFAHRGWTVQWPETLGVAGETFDHLVEMKGVPPLEVECKSIGEDKGRRIQRREVLDFYKLLHPHLKTTTRGLSRGLSAVVTLPSRLPSAHRDREGLAKALGQSIFRGVSCVLPDGTDIRIAEFDAGLLGLAPHDKQPHELRQAIDGVTSTRNCQAVLVGTDVGGALVMVVQSAKDDHFLKATFDTLSDAASRQLTSRRAGMLVAAFDGLGGEQLHDVAMDDQNSQSPPSALQLGASRFLSATSREFVVGLAFFSRSGLQPVEDGLVDATSGTAYYFPKRKSPLWNDRYSGLFAPRA
jgi:hypothetical protein